MSAPDTPARGLAIRAGADAARRTGVLMAAGQSGPIHGGAGAPYAVAHALVLAGDTVTGGATLRFRMQIAKYDPVNAGHQWRLRLVQGANAVVLAQNSVGASMRTLEIEQHIRIAYDRKAAFVFSPNTLNTPSLNAEAQIAATGVRGGIAANLGARQPSTGVMFVTNSAPPTAETVVIDFAQPVTVSVEVQPVNGDTVEVLGATLEMLAAGRAPVNTASPRAIAVWGDSLTEGTGATAVGGVPMDWVAQLRRQRSGWPIAAKGLGGQKAAAIVDRLLADPVAGRQWKAVLWIGTNDYDDHPGDGPGWWGAIRAAVDRALAARGGAGTVICTLHPRAGWAVGDAAYQALLFVNAQLGQRYGARVCDLFAALATDGGKVPAASMADAVHLANPGHAAVAAAVDAKISALGWG